MSAISRRSFGVCPETCPDVDPKFNAFSRLPRGMANDHRLLRPGSHPPGGRLATGRP